MRKTLLSLMFLTAFAGAGLATAASAETLAFPVAPSVTVVEYGYGPQYEDWRAREWRHREWEHHRRWEERRHEEWRESHRW